MKIPWSKLQIGMTDRVLSFWKDKNLPACFIRKNRRCSTVRKTTIVVALAVSKTPVWILATSKWRNCAMWYEVNNKNTFHTNNSFWDITISLLNSYAEQISEHIELQDHLMSAIRGCTLPFMFPFLKIAWLESAFNKLPLTESTCTAEYTLRLSAKQQYILLTSIRFLTHRMKTDYCYQ